MDGIGVDAGLRQHPIDGNHEDDGILGGHDRGRMALDLREGEDQGEGLGRHDVSDDGAASVGIDLKHLKTSVEEHPEVALRDAGAKDEVAFGNPTDGCTESIHEESAVFARDTAEKLGHDRNGCVHGNLLSGHIMHFLRENVRCTTNITDQTTELQVGRGPLS